ncbi:MAG: hypothetical protein CMP23_12660 [Rickettsiales bacterium]|nr:hypothetical protein [Rickettsiales bacterium]|tara:strand:+ start:3475 stop:3942 length:468 start_codon:yes stop_codon:yes gene_type:complete
MTDPVVSIRAAEAEDCRFYWQVNNEPSTRAQSISPEPIPWESHQRWYAQRLLDQETVLYVAELEGERVGVLRFDRAGEESTISVALAPAYRGRGLGRQIIASGTRASLDSGAVKRVIALVRPDNIGSVRAFLAAGYLRSEQTRVQGVELLQFVAS